MAWIESHDTLARHPKTKRLMRALGICRAQAIGHLHLLWWWTLDFAQDGNLSAFAADELADAAEWDGDPDQFLAALVQAGFVDAPATGGQAVHDWEAYAGGIIEQRERNAERQRAYRARHSAPPPSDDPPSPVRNAALDTGDIARNSYVTVMSPSRNGATVPNQTIPDPTVPEENLNPTETGASADTGAIAPARATRLPKPFLLTGAMREWAAEHTPGVDVQTETETFCDYWRAQPGQKGCKLDWEATWRNWMRRERKSLPLARGAQPPRAAPPPSPAEQAAQQQAAQARILDLQDRLGGIA